jgi:hypothetical protein
VWCHILQNPLNSNKFVFNQYNICANHKVWSSVWMMKRLSTGLMRSKTLKLIWTRELSPVLSLRGTFCVVWSIVWTLLSCCDSKRSVTPESRRCSTGLLTFFHRTKYGRFEPMNNAIINFNNYCLWFGFCGQIRIINHDV